MAKHNFLVERYQITLGDHPKTFGGVDVRPRGVVACFGEFLRLIYYFLPEGADAPSPMWSEDARLCVVFLPFGAMPAFVDLLQNLHRHVQGFPAAAVGDLVGADLGPQSAR